jgi:hypothetical protein
MPGRKAGHFRISESDTITEVREDGEEGDLIHERKTTPLYHPAHKVKSGVICK